MSEWKKICLVTDIPVLGVPGWWNPNGQIGFYDDASVFRAASVPLENEGTGATTAAHTR